MLEEFYVSFVHGRSLDHYKLHAAHLRIAAKFYDAVCGLVTFASLRSHQQVLPFLLFNAAVTMLNGFFCI